MEMKKSQCQKNGSNLTAVNWTPYIERKEMICKKVKNYVLEKWKQGIYTDNSKEAFYKNDKPLHGVNQNQVRGYIPPK